MNYLLQQVLNRNPPDLSLPSSYDYRRELLAPSEAGSIPDTTKKEKKNHTHFPNSHLLSQPGEQLLVKLNKSLSFTDTTFLLSSQVYSSF
jgi:hypothetical protein